MPINERASGKRCKHMLASGLKLQWCTGDVTNMKHREKMNGDEWLEQIHPVKCTLRQIKQLLLINSIQQKEKWKKKTYKYIQKHVLQGFL